MSVLYEGMSGRLQNVPEIFTLFNFFLFWNRPGQRDFFRALLDALRGTRRLRRLRFQTEDLWINGEALSHFNREFLIFIFR